jgi:hypothetical protein
VNIGAPEHGVGARTANVGTRGEQADVVFFRMLAALRQAIADGLQRHGMAVRAVRYALVHFCGAVLRRMMGHISAPISTGE